MARKARCPVCKESFELETDLEVGDTLNCPGCSAELKLTKLDPAEVEEEISSWDNYGDEDEEDFDEKKEKGEWL